MDKLLGSSDDKQKRGNSCTTFIVIAINIICVALGSNYQYKCYNGAADYLLWSGILGLSVSALTLIFMLSMAFLPFAICKDGKISRGEGCAVGAGCCIYWLLQLAVGVTQIVIMFWGFGVIFPAYGRVSFSPFKEDGKTPDLNYCAQVPFMFAFVLLIIKCVFFIMVAPCIICCCCCAGGLAALGMGAAASSRKEEEASKEEEAAAALA